MTDLDLVLIFSSRDAADSRMPAPTNIVGVGRSGWSR